jgi:hypothetical protein
MASASVDELVPFLYTAHPVRRRQLAELPEMRRGLP